MENEVHMMMTVVRGNDSLETAGVAVLNLINEPDADWNGDSGDDCLLDDARELGYETNNEYFVGEFLKGTKEADIESFLKEYYRVNSYWIHEVAFLPLQEEIEVDALCISLCVVARD